MKIHRRVFMCLVSLLSTTLAVFPPLAWALVLSEAKGRSEGLRATRSAERGPAANTLEAPVAASAQQTSPLPTAGLEEGEVEKEIRGLFEKLLREANRSFWGSYPSREKVVTSLEHYKTAGETYNLSVSLWEVRGGRGVEKQPPEMLLIIRRNDEAELTQEEERAIAQFRVRIRSTSLDRETEWRHLQRVTYLGGMGVTFDFSKELGIRSLDGEGGSEDRSKVKTLSFETGEGAILEIGERPEGPPRESIKENLGALLELFKTTALPFSKTVRVEGKAELSVGDYLLGFSFNPEGHTLRGVIRRAYGASLSEAEITEIGRLNFWVEFTKAATSQKEASTLKKMSPISAASEAGVKFEFWKEFGHESAREAATAFVILAATGLEKGEKPQTPTDVPPAAGLEGRQPSPAVLQAL